MPPLGDERRSSTEVDLFSDDFAIDEHQVADGFRPPKRTDQNPDIDSASNADTDHPEPHTLPSKTSTRSDATTMHITFNGNARPNSMRKSLSSLDNPFFSTEDDVADDSAIRREPSARSTVSAYPSLRPISTASSDQYATTHSFAHDHSGPSHPYTMYPQGIDMGRTASTSTHSTSTRSARQATAQQPSHPYAMYSQTIQDSDDDETSSPNHAPVGFPNTLRSDAMSIFTISEDLPPYSEYPEHGGPRHISPLPQLTSPPPPREPDQVHVPLLINMPPQSMSDARHIASDGPGSSDRLIDDQPALKKTWRQKDWKQRRATKFCGISLAWLIAMIAVILAILIVLAAGVGGYFRKQSERRAQFGASVADADGDGQWDPPGGANAVYYDADPIPTSTAGPVPTGAYSLQLGAPQEVQNDCLPASQADGWTCDLSAPQDMILNVGDIQSQNAQQGASIHSGSGANEYNYGSAPIDTVFSMLQLVTDMDAQGKGAAYQFQMLYNKLVVLPSSTFNSSTSGYEKRAAPPPLSRKTVVNTGLAPGEQPWFCYWNGTLLEGFIYLDEANSKASTPAPDTPADDCVLSPDTMSSASGNDSSQCPSGGTSAPLPLYPNSIKVEERRIAGSPAPYCTQMQILNNGVAAPIEHPGTTNDVTVLLQENDPSFAAYSSAGLRRSRKAKRSLVSGSCHCQWLSMT